MTEKTTKKAVNPENNQPDTLAVLSIVFGIVSLFGPGLLLGIPAIVMAGIVLKRDLPGRGLGIAGLITGTVSSVLSLLLIAFFALVVMWGIDNPEFFYEDELNYPQSEQQVPLYQGART